MDNAKTQSLFEWIVASVVMQKLVAVKQAEAGNEAIDRFTNVHSLQSESLVMLRGRDGEINSSGRKDFKLFQRRTSGVKLSWRSDPLQHFTENQIGQAQTLPAHFPVEPISLRCGPVPEVIDPHGRID